MPRMPNETEEEYELRKQRMRAQILRGQQQAQSQGMQAAMNVGKNMAGDSGSGATGSGPGLGTYAQLVGGVVGLDKVGDDLGVGFSDQKRAYKKIGGKMKDWLDIREWF